MHVPVTVFSVYPGERSAEFGDEVVPPSFVAVPPAAGDALGTGDEREPARRTVDVLKRQGESAHARLSRGEQAFELHEQAPRAEKERFGMDHLGGQLEPRGEALGQREKLARLGPLAERAVELVDYFLT